MDNTSHPNEKQLEAMLKLTAQRHGHHAPSLKRSRPAGRPLPADGALWAANRPPPCKRSSRTRRRPKSCSPHPRPKNCCSFWAARAEQSPDTTPVPGERGPSHGGPEPADPEYPLGPPGHGQIQGLLRSLNSGSGSSEAAAPEPPTAAPAGPDLSSLLGALAGSQPAGNPSTTALAGLTPQTLSLVSRLGPLLSQAGQEDDATRLLRPCGPC